MKDYKISVIIPIYNREKSLKNSLESIVNQTMDLNDIEVLMINDGSTDNSKKIVEEYVEKYPNFKAVHRKLNSGCAGIPRNIGLDNANGEYVIFLDSDDIYYENSFELLYNAINNSSDIDYARGRFLIDFKGYGLSFIAPTFYKSNTISYHVCDGSKTAKIANLFLKHSLDRIIRILQSKNSLKHIKFHIRDQKIKLCMLSIFCGIFRRDLIIENNLRFHNWKTSEDFIFTLEYLTKTKGRALVLNDEILYSYIKNIQDKGSLFMTSNLVNLPIGLFHYKEICDNSKMNTNILKFMPIWLLLFLKDKSITTEKYYELKEVINEFKKSSNTKIIDKIILNFVYYGMKIKISYK